MTTEQTRAHNRDIILMLLASLLWSSGGVLVKSVPWHPLAIGCIRAAVAGLVIGAYMLAQRIPFVITKKVVGVVLGLVLTSVPFVLATKLTTAANAIVIQYSAPLFVLLYGCVVKKAKLRAADAAVVLFTTVGVAICFMNGLGAGSVWGDLIAIVSGVGAAVTYIVTPDASSEERMSGLLIGQGMIVLIGMPFYLTSAPQWNAAIALCLLGLGIFQIGIAYILYARAARTCTPLACAVLSALEPLLNPVWVALFAGETPGVMTLIGGSIIIVSVTWWCVHCGKHPAETAAMQEAPALSPPHSLAR